MLGTTDVNGTEIYTPWVARQGDNAIFNFELIDKNGSGTLKVEFYHKNSDDTTNVDGTYISGSDIAATGTVGLHEKQVDGLRELVRCKLVIGGSGVDWVHWRQLDTVFFDTAKGA